MKKFLSFCVMKNMIGKILKELLNREGAPTKEDFSQMMGMSYKTLYNVMNGTSNLTFDQVVKASDLLNFEIIEEYYKRVGRKTKISSLEEPGEHYRKASNMITVNLSFRGAISSYENFSSLLMKIRDEASDLGFEVN